MPHKPIAQLKQIRGPRPGEAYGLCEDIVTIGSGSKNDIIIHDNEVSRQHCRLLRVLDDYELRDLGTRSGTFVNGQCVDESGWMLSARCLIEIGDAITLEYTPLTPDTGAIAAESSQPRYGLVVKHHSQPEAEMYPLGAVTTLGRDIHNDIVLDEPEVSRRHLQMTRTDEGFLLEDLGALNGVHVNGQRVSQQHLLQPDDRIAIGTRVTLWLAPMPASPPEPAQPRIPAQRHKDSTLIEGGQPQPGDLHGRVFVVYAPADWETLIRPMFAYLQRHAVAVWAAHGLSTDSRTWEKAIEQAQNEAGCLLVVITRLSLRTPYVLRSIRHFIAREKPIVLAQYEDAGPLPLYMQHLPILTYEANAPECLYRDITARIRAADADH